MMRKIFSAAILGLATFSASADTPKDMPLQAERIPALVEMLERDAPLDQASRDLRKALFLWVMETPDYSVTVCAEMIRPTVDKKTPNGGELTFQYMFGNVSYQITHPGQHPETILQTAGVESMLKAYATMLARDPKARIPEFDTLIEKKASTPLHEILAPVIAEHCVEK